MNASLLAMDRTVYVIGHRNPDTDSIVSAVAYAHLKRALGMKGCVAARAGNANPQTEYVFERFGIPLPIFLTDLIPKVEHYLDEDSLRVPIGLPLWEALSLMQTHDRKAIPIVNPDGSYHSTLHYGAFAQNLIKKINPHKKAVISTSLGRIISTIQAQAICVFDPQEIFRGHLVVAALETESFKRHLAAEDLNSAIVLVGDRGDIQRFAIESGVRALIITNGNMIDKELRELAETKRVSVLVSPYDTSSTSLLTIYSTPAETMSDPDIQPLSNHETIRRARAALASSPSRSVPIVDDAAKVIGLFTESDLLSEPDIDIILVDHNELSQAIEGVENFRVLEVIDHHRIGSLVSREPITFINRVVGSTSTIVAGMYRENRLPLPLDIASILLCGILSDTLGLQSATTTETDRDCAEYLSGIAKLEIQMLARDILDSASQISSKSAQEIIGMDMKEYQSKGHSFTISQVEVNSPQEIMEKAEEVFQALARARERRGFLFSALMVTDITELSSLLFVEGEKEFLSLLRYPKQAEGIFALKDILSRKKQLLPVCIELVERYAEL